MVDVFREVRRVLRDDGTLWLNLGDSYASGGTGWRPGNLDKNGGNSNRDGTPVPDGLKPKNLVGIPWRVAFALQADGWYLRSDIIWSKPNPMPESVTDRPTKSHEYVFLLTKSPRYYFDADAVREPVTETSISRLAQPGLPTQIGSDRVPGKTNGNMKAVGDPSGRNIRSVWTIATQPYPGAHFATFPEKLVEPCVKAGTSERGVCPECGAPWVRMVEPHRNGRDWNANNRAGGPRLVKGQSASDRMADDYRPPTTTGWRPSCAHAAEPVPAAVLDPFAGSGTVGRVANRLGRRAVLIDLSADYIDQAMLRNAQAPLGLGA
jgi:DNA modification methylase